MFVNGNGRIKFRGYTMNLIKMFMYVFLFAIIVNCSKIEDLRILSQKSGPWQTNSYLLYDVHSKEAALVDVGVSIDTLIMHINNNDLKLKYVFITHCHQDHIAGVPELLKQFPDAKLCFTKDEYDDMKFYSQWQDLYPSQMVKEWEKYPEIVNLMNFDYSLIGEPDIYVEENQMYKLGDFKIRALKIPGHSRGSVCYHVNNNLFSGDLLYFNTVGLLEYKFGSKDDIVKSVRRLYELFPDEAIIYAGHGPISNIGYEKKNNQTVTLN